jgi:hypothetical protein
MSIGCTPSGGGRGGTCHRKSIVNHVDVSLWLLEHPLLFVGLSFASVMLAFALGRRLPGPPPEANESVKLLEGATFALVGLLFAFTFASAASRFDARRALIVDEANAIGTAKLRVDLVPADARAPLLDAFDRYIAARVEVGRTSTDAAATARAYARTAEIQQEIWAMALEAGRRPDAPPAVNQQLVPALNAMFDMATTRAMALAARIPAMVPLSLWFAIVVATVVAGRSGRVGDRVPWLTVAGYAITVTICVYLIIDFEYPRAGLIRVDDFDALLRSL